MNPGLIRMLIVYGTILPLAIVVGWMLSNPLHTSSMAVIGGVLFVLLLPVILAHHQAVLFFSFNAMVTAFFLRGQPYFWTLMVAISLGIALFYRILQRRSLFISAPWITASLVIFTLVVLVTAQLRGTVGFRVLGSSTYGAKNYFYLIFSILAYFAIVSHPLPLDRYRRYLGMYFVSGVTAIVGSLLYYAPPLWILYTVFPSGLAGLQAQADVSLNPLNRFGGLAVGGSALAVYFLYRFGVGGMFSISKWWRLPLFLLAVAISLLGGFRSSLVSLLMLFGILVIVEGLIFSRVAFSLLAASVLGMAVLVPLADKLPLAMQRTLSILPLEIDARARLDAESSIRWRLRMWEALVPELPNYLWLGKGYAVSPIDLHLARESTRRGHAPDYTGSLAAGDYHNGPLSLYIPFGLPGVAAFLFFAGVATRTLFLNFKYGDPGLRTANRFLFAYFVARLTFFLTMFGALSQDFMHLATVTGLSVALNRGVKTRPVEEPRLAPANPSFGLPAAGAA